MRNLYRALIVLILLSPGLARAAAPTIVGSGVDSTSTGNCNSSWGGGCSTGDLLFIYAESRSEEATTPIGAGFTELYVGYTTETGTAGTRLSVFYKVATGSCTGFSSSMNDAGDHTTCDTLTLSATTYEEVHTLNADNPVVQESTTSSRSIAGVNTTVTDCLLMYFVTGEQDEATPRSVCSAWTDASLSSITERCDYGSASGDGGMLCMATGTFTGPGASGTMTVTTHLSNIGVDYSLAVCAPYTSHRVIMIGSDGTTVEIPKLADGRLDPNPNSALVRRATDSEMALLQ